MQNYDYLLKLKIIGDIGTGKSSILLRFCEDTFYHGYYTNGVDFKIKTIKVDNLAVKLQIWDILDYHRHYRPLTYSNYRGVSGIIVVFDKSNRKSFEDLEKYVEEIKGHASHETIFIFVGNKCDLQAQVTQDEAQEKALKHQVLYMDVSAKNGTQIENIFQLLVRQILTKLTL